MQLFEPNCNGGGGVGEGGDPTTFGTPNGGGLDGGLGDMAGGGGAAGGMMGGEEDTQGGQQGGGAGGGFSGDPHEFINAGVQGSPQRPANYKEDCQDRACFPGYSLVHVTRGAEKEQRRMDSIQPGDMVLVERDGNLLNEPVLGFLHSLPSVSANVVEIRHEHGNFSASAAHIVPVVSAAGPREQFVGALKAGDRMYAAVVDSAVAQVKETTVLAIEHKVTTTGLWAPFTASGTIVVDGIVASAYASPSPQWPLPHAAAHTVLFWPRVYSQYIAAWDPFRSEEPAEVQDALHPFLTVMEHFAPNGRCKRSAAAAP
eukprot:TRINITY_DN3069_c0_g1_i11.p3 TRINITY_DN3069_c0_g1~~TRINITY_DN3069_c0_g1_i11.p3  ORF type:complete len:315 (+),score=60.26 TRINITY_DN3069_c0_g1_i11:1221-2165(+)